MIVKTSKLIGDQLDWVVREALINSEDSRGRDALISETVLGIKPAPYSKWWMFGGEIIEREWLHPTPWPNHSDEDLRWSCTQHDATEPICERGPTPLVAAMRCYVVSKFGDEVDIPEELL